MLPLLSAAVVFALSQANPPSTPEDIPRLIEQIKTTYATGAPNALARIGRPAVPALLEVLRDHSLPSIGGVRQPARYQAALALQYMGGDAAQAVPALLEILADGADDEGVRWAAAAALGSIGQQPDDCVPALVAVLDEPGSYTSSLGWYVVGALAQLAAQQPAARPALTKALSKLERAHEAMGGSAGFAQIFGVLKPPSARQVAQEDDIREAVLRHSLTRERDVWCISREVNDVVFKRLTRLKVARDLSECSTSEPHPPEPNETGSLDLTVEGLETHYRSLSVGAIDWLSADRVHTSTMACFGFMPCFDAYYVLQRRNGRWVVVSESHPPAI